MESCLQEEKKRTHSPTHPESLLPTLILREHIQFITQPFWTFLQPQSCIHLTRGLWQDLSVAGFIAPAV